MFWLTFSFFIQILCQVDDRFFWNKHMIQELIDLQVTSFFVQKAKPQRMTHCSSE